MSFLKITDPSKRAAIVNEYLKLKKSIQQSSLSEKLGDSDLQRDLIKLYKPITESQAGIAKELSDTSTALKALPASISTSLQALMPAESPFSQYPSIEAFETSSPAFEDPTQRFGPLATKHLPATDKTFGIKLENGKFYLGSTQITIDGNDVTVGEKTYTGTPGLWELLTEDMPNKSIYNPDDLENYEDIMVKTNAMCAINKKDGTRILNKPAASKSNKYKEIIKQMWHRNKPKANIAFGRKTTGKAVTTPETSSPTPIILPSDPNELLEKLDLTMAAYDAGNTGVVDEAIAIFDELRRQGVIDKETYKKYMTDLKR